MISLFKKILTLVLWPATWSTLESVLHVLRKNVYSAVVGWIVLCMSVMSSWCMVFKFYIYWLILWLDILFFIESGHNWSFQLLLWNFLFLLFCHCFVNIFWDSIFWCIYVYNCSIFLMNYPFCLYDDLFVFCYNLFLTSLVEISITTSVVITVFIEYPFPSFHCIWI